MKKIIALCIFATILSACIPREALSELERLCEKDAGLTVYRTVEESGYFDGNPMGGNFWLNLIDSDYRFIEACFATPQSYYPLNEPGCWRVTKVSRSTGDCNKRIDKELTKFRAHAAFARDKCFEAEKQALQMARYGIFITSEWWSLNNHLGSRMYRLEKVIKDMRTHELLAEEVTYALSPEPEASPFPRQWKYCHSLDGGYMRSPTFLQEVILAP